MSPLTNGAPKEMLPVAGSPMIHHVVQEAADAGLVEICIVIRNGKEAIRRYFEYNDPEVGKLDPAVEKLQNRCRIVFTYQVKPRGIGDAILCAKDFVGDDCFALLIPDQLFIGPAGAISQLANKKLPPNAAISGVICIPASEIADKIGSTKVTNIVRLGALLEETECLLSATAWDVIENKVKKVELLEANRKALAAGRHFVDEHAHEEALTQPDGYAG